MRKVFLFGLLAVAACGGGDGGKKPTAPVRVDKVALSHGSANLIVGDSILISATLSDANGNTIAGRTITWTTSNVAVARVSTTGWVVGMGAGSATVTASSDGKTDLLSVTVAPVPVATVEVSPAASALQIGQTAQLSVTTKDARNNVLVGRRVTWASSDVSKANVTIDGLVTAVGNGSASISATSEGQTGQAQISIGSTAAPLITSVSGTVLTPGASFVLTGANFGASPAQNLVTIDGVGVTVSAASATELTISLPPAASFACEATHAANVVVSVNDLTGSRQVPLQVATQRSLAKGESLILLNSGDVRCNELAQTGGRYFVSVMNTGVISAQTTFQLRGSTATVLASAAKQADLGSFSTRSSTGTFSFLKAAPRFPGLTAVQTRRMSTAHNQLLAQSRAAFAGASGSALRQRRSRSDVSLHVIPPTLGAVAPLKIPNRKANLRSDSIAIQGKVVYVGSKSMIIEDVASPLAGTMDATWQQLGQEYDNVMHAILTNNFGDPLALDSETDNNGRIIMVFSPVINGWGDIFGFVSPFDFFPAATYKSSNQGEFFYAVVPTISSGTGGSFPNLSVSLWRRYIRGTIIHEVKHIASIAEHINRSTVSTVDLEESWMEEGTALHAEEFYFRQLTGKGWKQNIDYANSLALEYSATNDLPLVMFYHFSALYDYLTQVETHSPLGSIASDDGSFYGSAWSFIRWAADHYATDEPAFFRSLVQQGTGPTGLVKGIANLEARTGRPFPELLAEWALASLLDDDPSFTPAAGSRLTFPSWNLRSIFAGNNQRSPQGFPRSVPISPRPVAFGNFAVNVNSLIGGTAAYFELTGTQSGKQLVELRSQGGNAPDPSLRISLVRVQ